MQRLTRLERVTCDAQGEDRLARLERAGLLRRAKLRTPLKALRAAVPKPRRSVTQALLQERRKSR